MMENSIELRFGGDKFLEDKEKLFYIRYINRVLHGLKEDIIYNRGYLIVTSKIKTEDSIRFVSNNNELNKLVNLKLFNSPPL
ncbi:hypothetical protein FW778_13470 [Ginsengibacter hankyongi]|uniref:Uncharacterized protein n=1 Tax=Ginsengibacter hankyongi TaxID=2607284 RepID=A0A5J5IFD9_9BACT|nr:hypothetical protein [Ginsengibacter hankyongi]KAA9038563.1 hypothetical protein FW778_13470 [Ginsengibacter hankyongi]